MAIIIENKKDMMSKDANGLNKARLIFGIIASVLSILAFTVMVLYFFFNVKTGLATLDEEFHKHLIQDEKKFAQIVPAKQLEVEFKAITTTLIEIKKQLRDCQAEDKEFKEQLFQLMLEMKE